MGGPIALTSPMAPWPRPAHDVARLRPMARLGRRLSALSADSGGNYAVTELGPGSAPGPEWLPVSAAIPTMTASTGTHLTISPAVAGARLAGTLGYAAVGRLAVALAVTGQAYDTGPDSLLIRLDDDGLVDQIGVRNPTLAVSADDPLAGHAAVTTMVDRAAVIDWAAERALATLEPLIEELHELTRYGRVPMWNLVADTVLGPAGEAARRAGLDRLGGRAIGHALLDALVARGAPIHRRGTLLDPAEIRCDPSDGDPDPAKDSHGPINGRPGPGKGDHDPADDRCGLPEDGVIVIRGACCLYFRQTGDKCGGCPLVRR